MLFHCWILDFFASWNMDWQNYFRCNCLFTTLKNGGKFKVDALTITNWVAVQASKSMFTSNNQVVHNNFASLTVVSCTVFDAHSKVGYRHFLQEDNWTCKASPRRIQAVIITFRQSFKSLRFHFIIVSFIYVFCVLVSSDKIFLRFSFFLLTLLSFLFVVDLPCFF